MHGPVTAACPQRVLACLMEKGVEFEVVHVDLNSGEQKRPQFLVHQVKIAEKPLFTNYKKNIYFMRQAMFYQICYQYVFLNHSSLRRADINMIDRVNCMCTLIKLLN